MEFFHPVYSTIVAAIFGAAYPTLWLMRGNAMKSKHIGAFSVPV